MSFSTSHPAGCIGYKNLILWSVIRFNEPKQTVLFRRGEAAFGMFLVLEGKVSLDFGVDGSNPLNRAYGPGALVGLPATLTGHNYSMTATVTEDAESGIYFD
jgi:CRP-like cAMP-binding protein